jgi:hypothetical protein
LYRKAGIEPKIQIGQKALTWKSAT